MALSAWLPAPTATPRSVVPSASGTLMGPEVKLGAVFPITGRFTDFARKNRVALELAVDEINAHGGIVGVPIEAVIADDASQPPEAADLLHKLSGDDKVLAVLGPFRRRRPRLRFRSPTSWECR